MKKILLTGILMVFLLSCSTTSKFPVSSLVPAAEISVKKKTDKNNNQVLIVTANNLASPERLTPSRGAYVVWIQTEGNGIKNIGQLKNQNAKKATLKTLSVFAPVEIFITAEDAGNISYPQGTEVARISFNKK